MLGWTFISLGISSCRTSSVTGLSLTKARERPDGLQLAAHYQLFVVPFRAGFFQLSLSGAGLGNRKRLQSPICGLERRMVFVSARPPSRRTRLRALSIFPDPVSPVMTVRPGPNPVLKPVDEGGSC